MLTVYKYQVRHGVVAMALPQGAKVLCARSQNETIQLWALVDTNAPLENRCFLVVQTSENISIETEKLIYIGTVELDGWWIGHVFEVKA